MNKYITGTKFKETIDKMGILGIKREKLNDWVELIGTEKYDYRYSMDERSIRTSNNQQSISIIIESKQVIIENIKMVIYHKKYLVITFIDKTRLIATQEGKTVDLNKTVYSEKTGRKFELKYIRDHNHTESDFIITKVVGEEAIAVINEAGKVLKINTGMYGESVRTTDVIANDGTDAFLIYLLGHCGIGGGLGKISKMIYVDKDLNVKADLVKPRTGGSRKTTYEDL